MLFGLIGKKKSKEKKKSKKDSDFSLEDLRNEGTSGLKSQVLPESGKEGEKGEGFGSQNKKKKSFFQIEFGARSVTKDKKTLLENLALLLASGMGVGSALRTLRKNSQNRKLQKNVSLIIKDIEDGEPLWQALENQKFLPIFMISLIKIGEETGNLADKIQKTVTSLDKEHKRRSQLRTALFYPAFVLTLTVVVALGVSIFVLPRIGQVFDNLNAELPWITSVMISFGLFLETYWYLVVPAIIIAVGMLIFFGFIFPATKWTGQWVLFHAPVFNTLITRTEVSRFCYNLAMLINSGIPITRSLVALSEVHDYYMYKKFVMVLAEELKQGKSFHKSFEDHRKQSNSLFPFTAQEIITAGEESGSLPQVLSQVGKKFEEEAEEISRSIAVLLEPVLLIVIWAGVVFLAIAILLPIYNLVGTFNA